MAWQKGYNKINGLGEKIAAQIAQDVFIRQRQGAAKYGPDFKGDPLQQAYEEALDLAVYLLTEIKRRAIDEQSREDGGEEVHGAS